jgi:hypothetical protein
MSIPGCWQAVLPLVAQAVLDGDGDDAVALLARMFTEGAADARAACFAVACRLLQHRADRDGPDTSEEAKDVTARVISLAAIWWRMACELPTEVLLMLSWQAAHAVALVAVQAAVTCAKALSDVDPDGTWADRWLSVWRGRHGLQAAWSEERTQALLCTSCHREIANYPSTCSLRAALSLVDGDHDDAMRRRVELSRWLTRGAELINAATASEDVRDVVVLDPASSSDLRPEEVPVGFVNRLSLEQVCGWATSSIVGTSVAPLSNVAEALRLLTGTLQPASVRAQIAAVLRGADASDAPRRRLSSVDASGSAATATPPPDSHEGDVSSGSLSSSVRDGESSSKFARANSAPLLPMEVRPPAGASSRRPSMAVSPLPSAHVSAAAVAPSVSATPRAGPLAVPTTTRRSSVGVGSASVDWEAVAEASAALVAAYRCTDDSPTAAVTAAARCLLARCSEVVGPSSEARNAESSVRAE